MWVSPLPLPPLPGGRISPAPFKGGYVSPIPPGPSSPFQASRSSSPESM